MAVTPTKTTEAKADTAPATEKPIRDQLAATRDTIRSEAGKKASDLKAEASNVAGQASAKARELANSGKGKAAEAVGGLAKMIEDSASTVDTKLGAQYGDYARSAATAVSGLATSLEKQDIDELVTSTREWVKKSPAVAIGAAAVVGFVLARLFSGSSSDTDA